MGKKRGGEFKRRAEKYIGNMLSGLVVNWESSDPLQDRSVLTPGRVHNTSPAKNMYCRDVYGKSGAWIANGKRFLWRVTITTVFIHSEGKELEVVDQLEGYELLDDISDCCVDVIRATREDNLTNKHLSYKTTFFKAELVSDRPAQKTEEALLMEKLAQGAA